jgi:hypothetical protein
MYYVLVLQNQARDRPELLGVIRCGIYVCRDALNDVQYSTVLIRPHRGAILEPFTSSNSISVARRNTLVMTPPMS